MQQTLMATFKFTDADLLANRSGKLTSAQKERLRDKQHFYLAAYGIATTISAVFFGGSVVSFDGYNGGALLNSIMMKIGRASCRERV